MGIDALLSILIIGGFLTMGIAYSAVVNTQYANRQCADQPPCISMWPWILAFFSCSAAAILVVIFLSGALRTNGASKKGVLPSGRQASGFYLFLALLLAIMLVFSYTAPTGAYRLYQELSTPLYGCATNTGTETLVASAFPVMGGLAILACICAVYMRRDRSRTITVELDSV
jgi:predicted small integral membrane protein